MPYSELQHKILSHLAGGSGQRRDALNDLVDRGVMSPELGRYAEPRVEQYLKENPRGFCAEGIQRFRDAVGLPATPRKAVVRVVLDVEVESTKGDSRLGTSKNRDCRAAENVAGSIRHAGRLGDLKVLNASWVSYTATPSTMDFGGPTGSGRSLV